MLARRLPSKQAAAVCVKGAARSISSDQRRPDLFRTRLCSNKKKTMTTMLCVKYSSIQCKHARPVRAEFVSGSCKMIKMATCSVKIRPCLLNFSNTSHFTLRAITHTAKHVLCRTMETFFHVDTITRKVTQIHASPPLSTLLFNRYCIDVKSKFYTHANKQY